MPWSGWSSCCGSPSRTRLAAHGDAATASARDIWARLIDEKDVDGAGHLLPGPEPGGTADHVNRTPFQRVQCGGVVLQEDGIPEGGLAACPLTDPHPDPAFLRRLSGLRQQLSDDLVAVGRHADPLTLFHQVDYHLGAHGALARARRPLDGEIALVEGRGNPAGSGLRRLSWCQEFLFL